jgi:hypothetical protein
MNGQTQPKSCAAQAPQPCSVNKEPNATATCGFQTQVLRPGDRVFVLKPQDVRGHKDTVTDIAHDSLHATILIDGISHLFPADELKRKRSAHQQGTPDAPALDAHDAYADNAEGIDTSANSPLYTTSEPQVVPMEVADQPSPSPPPKKRHREHDFSWILGCRGTPGMDRFYRVQWDTNVYSQSHDSWEPEFNFPEGLRSELVQSWTTTTWRALFDVTITDILLGSAQFPQRSKCSTYILQDAVMATPIALLKCRSDAFQRASFQPTTYGTLIAIALPPSQRMIPGVKTLMADRHHNLPFVALVTLRNALYSLSPDR